MSYQTDPVSGVKSKKEGETNEGGCQELTNTSSPT